MVGAAAHNASDASMPVARVCRTIHSSYMKLLLVTLLLIVFFFNNWQEFLPNLSCSYEHYLSFFQLIPEHFSLLLARSSYVPLPFFEFSKNPAP